MVIKQQHIFQRNNSFSNQENEFRPNPIRTEEKSISTLFWLKPKKGKKMLKKNNPMRVRLCNMKIVKATQNEKEANKKKIGFKINLCTKKGRKKKK